MKESNAKTNERGFYFLISIMCTSFLVCGIAGFQANPIIVNPFQLNYNFQDKINGTSTSTSECDESFIRSKMDQMDRDILELNKVGERKYYVRYISWSSGTAVEGDQILDYSNSPCND